MRRNYKLFIEDIWEAMNKIEKYISGLSYEDRITPILAFFSIIDIISKKLDFFVLDKCAFAFYALK